MQDEIHYQRVADFPGLVLSEGQFANFSFDRHYHLDCHIGIVPTGVQRQRYAGRTEYIGPGWIALMPPGVIHDGIGEDRKAYTLKTFRIAYPQLCKLWQEICGSQSEPELPPQAIADASLAHRLTVLHARLQTTRIDQLAIQGEWLDALQHLFRQAAPATAETRHHRLSVNHLNDLRDYCMAHLADKVTLEDLATLCGLTRFQFLRQFKQTTGMTPHAWLLRMRLEQACALLVRGGEKLTDIAQEVGFFDQSHFNRAFRHAFGVPPSHY